MHPLLVHHRRALRNLGRDGIPLDVVKEFDDHVNVGIGEMGVRAGGGVGLHDTVAESTSTIRLAKRTWQQSTLSRPVVGQGFGGGPAVQADHGVDERPISRSRRLVNRALFLQGLQVVEPADGQQVTDLLNYSSGLEIPPDQSESPTRSVLLFCSTVITEAK
jgi:hypothetical protein